MSEPRPFSAWTGEPGALTTWSPTPAARAAMAAAPKSHVPASRQQEQHLRAYRRNQAAGLPMARLLTLVWDEPGRCDVRAMTYALNAHLRRHDTYAGRFTFDADDRVVRHQLADPATLELAPTGHGVVDAAGVQERVLATPGPLEWDCFAFGVVQHPDHFTVHASIDHLHADALFMSLLFGEVHATYRALAAGGGPPRLPEAASYLAFCSRQDAELAALTADSAEIRDWRRFLAGSGGSLPRFPLPLGDPGEAHLSDMVVFPLLDAGGSAAFERVCEAVGARQLGGLLACAARVERALAGTGSYAVITPTTTRSTPEEHRAMGWYTGVVPLRLEGTDRAFADLAREAQEAYDTGLPLARVPIERVLELADPPLAPATAGVPMLSFLDTGLPPLDPAVMQVWEECGGRALLNRGAAHQVGMWVTRTRRGMSLSVAFPDNLEARASVSAYAAALADEAARVAGGGAR